MWETEIPIIVRTLIDDWGSPPMYSDDRLTQVIIVAASYVTRDANLTTPYSINIIEETITPDPCAPESLDEYYKHMIALKTACILDQSTFRTKAINEGIRTSLGSANISVAGNLSGYKTILEIGPCKVYTDLINNYNIGNATVLEAILSPFVGNRFDPRYYSRNIGHSRRDNIY